jgi:hypothetical protein
VNVLAFPIRTAVMVAVAVASSGVPFGWESLEPHIHDEVAEAQGEPLPASAR